MSLRQDERTQTQPQVEAQGPEIPKLSSCLCVMRGSFALVSTEWNCFAGTSLNFYSPYQRERPPLQAGSANCLHGQEGE